MSHLTKKGLSQDDSIHVSFTERYENIKIQRYNKNQAAQGTESWPEDHSLVRVNPACTP